MYQLKDLVILILYIFIFVDVFLKGNIIISAIVFILVFNYLKSRKILYSIEKHHHEQMYSQRNDFINSLNHDLRIPIIAQIRALELVKNRILGEINSAQEDMLYQIERSCKCVLNLTSLMINNYKIENNVYTLKFEKVNISDIIISCFDELSVLSSEKNITFEYQSEKKNADIMADRDELKKVILNILLLQISNANLGEKISVIISLINNKIKLTISTDNRTFYVNPENSVYTSVGHNIKMAFCKKIIAIHNGKLLENEDNSFSCEFPQIA